MKSSITYVKKVLNGFRAKKKFGQNFIIDSNVVEKIARNACDQDLLTLEIGPGLGALTEYLLKYSKAVDAYEIDKDMYDVLMEEFKDAHNLHVYLEDFLKTDLSKYHEKINVCANLPYYVTTPILFKLFESNLDISKITVMVQKEVADRLIAKTNEEDYNALSVIVQYLYNVNLEMNVSKKVFYPSPKVDSAIVSFVNKVKRDFVFEEKLFGLIKICFKQRRKTLHNNLKEHYDSDIIDKVYNELGFDSNIRAQELLLDDFIKIYKVIYER